MSVIERPLQFGCEGQRLLGVLSEPVAPAASGDLGMLIVVGGPQVRTGSHRQFVQQARAAAAAGVPTLRFDVRGMGDSEGELRNFEHLSPDIGAAIDALQHAVPAVRRVVLWGLCDGASAALLYLADSGHDPRVQGLVLLNPWVRSEATLAATHVKHYYGQRLLQREFWAKLLSGRVAGDALRGVVKSVTLMLRPAAAGGGNGPPTTYQQRMACAWARFGGRVLLVLSGEDYTAKEFAQAWAGVDWTAARAHPALERLDIAGADHTFSQLTHQRDVEAACLRWLNAAQRTGKTSATEPACRAPATDHEDALR